MFTKKLVPKLSLLVPIECKKNYLHVKFNCSNNYFVFSNNSFKDLCDELGGCLSTKNGCIIRTRVLSLIPWFTSSPTQG